jgi:hypothetical protein
MPLLLRTASHRTWTTTKPAGRRVSSCSARLTKAVTVVSAHVAYTRSSGLTDDSKMPIARCRAQLQLITSICDTLFLPVVLARVPSACTFIEPHPQTLFQNSAKPAQFLRL